jgi:hypothetical protein
VTHTLVVHKISKLNFCEKEGRAYIPSNATQPILFPLGSRAYKNLIEPEMCSGIFANVSAKFCERMAKTSEFKQ